MTQESLLHISHLQISYLSALFHHPAGEHTRPLDIWLAILAGHVTRFSSASYDSTG